MSDEDSLLERLAGRARAEEEAESPHLRAAIAGEAGRDPADRATPTGDPQIDELLAPLPARVRQSLIEGAVSALGEAPRPLEGPPPLSFARPAGVRRRKTAWIAAAAAPLALAAGLLLWVNRASPLPVYSLELSGTVDTVRGESAPAEVPLVETGAPLTVVLRPERGVQGVVAARAFWVKGSCLQPWPATVERAEGGGLRLTGPGQAPCGAGDGALVVVVGRGLSAGAQAGPGEQRVVRPVRWR
jgi:hypothetical protein